MAYLLTLIFVIVIQIKNAKIPNFDQFIEFVLDPERIGTTDAHLVSYWWKCDMCRIPYNVIGKVETSKQDMDYISSKVRCYYNTDYR